MRYFDDYNKWMLECIKLGAKEFVDDVNESLNKDLVYAVVNVQLIGTWNMKNKNGKILSKGANKSKEPTVKVKIFMG